MPQHLQGMDRAEGSAVRIHRKGKARGSPGPREGGGRETPICRVAGEVVPAFLTRVKASSWVWASTPLLLGCQAPQSTYCFPPKSQDGVPGGGVNKVPCWRVAGQVPRAQALWGSSWGSGQSWWANPPEWTAYSCQVSLG